MRIGLKTAALILLGAGTAAAATSGLPIDGPVNSWVHFISTDVAIAAIGAGAGGFAYHAATGRDFGHLTGHAGGLVVGGGFCSLVQPTAAAMGLSAGAALTHDPYSASIGVLLATNALIVGVMFLGVVRLRRLWAGLRSIF